MCYTELRRRFILFEEVFVMKKRYLRLAALTAGVLLAAQTGLSAAALSTFDAAYYAAQYPDVAAVCGNDEGALLRHYLDHGIDEGRKPSADGIAGDDELSLTEAQFSSVWSPVAINKLAHYKSLKRKCTDEEFAQAYQEALKVVTPLALMSREKESPHSFPASGKDGQSPAHFPGKPALRHCLCPACGGG